MSNVKALSFSSSAIAKREKATLAKHDERQAIYDTLFAGEEFAYIEEVQPAPVTQPAIVDTDDSGRAIDPQGFTARLLAALRARAAEVSSGDTDTAIRYAQASHVSIDACMGSPAFAETGARFVKLARQSENIDKANYIAVKVLVKVVKLASAIGEGLHSRFDAHTRLLGFQLAKLEKLTSKTGLVVQTKSAIYDALDVVQNIDLKHTRNYTIGTAGTQLSSSRMLFGYLDICTINKGKANDPIIVKDNARARAFISMFRNKEVDSDLDMNVINGIVS